MIKTLFFRIAAVLSGVMLLMLGGCIGKSQPPRFYTLTPIADGTTALALDASVGIGPVKLADYLDQSRIVTRGNGNLIIEAEFDQWSGSLKDNLTNVMAENIGSLLATDRIFLYPWRTYMPVDYQVTLDITRLDGQPGGEVFLVARWIVLSGKEKKVIAMKQTNIQEKTDTGSYEGLVAAQSRALGRLSLEISEALRTSVE